MGENFDAMILTLEPHEAKAVLCALSLVAMSDGTLGPQEQQQLQGMAHTLEIKDEEVDRIIESAISNPEEAHELLKSVDRPWVARAVFRDAVLMMRADSEVLPEERLVLERIRMNLGVKEEDSSAILAWVEDVYQCQQRGEILVRDGMRSSEA